jgi:arylsulfatase A-like enzyme
MIQPNQKRIAWFCAILSALFFSSTIYFWFLQPADVISRLRLLIAFGLWIIFAYFSFIVFSFLQKRIRSTQNNLILAIGLSFLLSGVIYNFLIDKKSIPSNLFLLPRQDIIIEIKADKSPKDIQLTGFYNGLSPVSFSALKLSGTWELINENTLKHIGSEAASIKYSGWMVENHFIEFRKNPTGGDVIIHWNNNDQFIDLSSKNEQKVKFNYPFAIPKRSKNSIVFLTIISIFIVCFPLIQFLVNKLSKNRDLIKFDQWFADTTINLQKFALISSIICVSATIFLLITPLINSDREALTLDKNTSAKTPNIFLIIVDALSAEDMSLFGYPLNTTPNLKRITKDWSVYANAQTPSVCSIGVYPSLITGHYPYIMRPFAQYGDQVHSSNTWTDLFQILKQSGYETYWSGYLPPGFYHTGSGIDSTFGMPYFKQLMDAWFQMKGIRKQYFPYIPISVQQPEKYSSTQFDDYRLQQAIQLLKTSQLRSPFFLYLHYDGVHVMPGIEWIYPTGSFQGTFSPAEDPKIRLQYDEAILNQDYQIDEFIEQLKSIGLYDSSMIIILADHGQVFRQGSLAQCSTEITLNETHVPLLIKYPNQVEGELVTSIVSTIDLTPTILDVLEINYSPDWFDGHSLLNKNLNLMNERFVFSGNTFMERYRSHITVMDDTYKLVLRGSQYFLYDYKNDPDEKNDLMEVLGMENPLVKKLMGQLDSQRKKIF